MNDVRSNFFSEIRVEGTAQEYVHEDMDDVATRQTFHSTRYSYNSTHQGSASVTQTDALGESQEIARLDTGNYFGEVCIADIGH